METDFIGVNLSSDKILVILLFNNILMLHVRDQDHHFWMIQQFDELTSQVNDEIVYLNLVYIDSYI